MYVFDSSVLFISLYEWRGFFCSRMMSVYVWRPSVRVWSCRAFRLTRCPGLRREPCCNKRSASIDATSSSSTWSSGGSLCTGGLDARKTLETTRCTQRWVRRGFCGLTFYLRFYRWNDSLHFWALWLFIAPETRHKWWWSKEIIVNKIIIREWKGKDQRVMAEKIFFFTFAPQAAESDEFFNIFTSLSCGGLCTESRNSCWFYLLHHPWRWSVAQKSAFWIHSITLIIQWELKVTVDILNNT